MDTKDKELLNKIQRDFPVCTRPYLRLAEDLDLSEDEVIARISKLKEDGIIRRLGGTFDSRKMGYKSTLCAMEVPPERIEEVSQTVNSFVGVTHNYLREHKYNMWFTLIAPNPEAVFTVLEKMKEQTGIEEILYLPATNFFKINVNFDMKEV